MATQQNSSTLPKTPTSNGKPQPGTTGPQVKRTQGGSRKLAPIPVKPDAAPDYTTPIQPERARLNGSESGRC